MSELPPHAVESLRRSVAMTTPGDPSGLGRDVALQVLSQLQAVTTERDSLMAELVEAGLA